MLQYVSDFAFFSGVFAGFGAAGITIAIERSMKLIAFNARIKKASNETQRKKLIMIHSAIKKQLALSRAVGVAGMIVALALYKKNNKMNFKSAQIV